MTSANGRIARNTLYMYARLVTTMVVGLYVSRLALEVLGVSDYGLFAVVGGVLAMFTFISSSLASATSRFLNIEMGRKGGEVNTVFNVNLALHTALALIVLALAETVGLWYVCHHLNIAEGKLDDAVFVYQVSMLTACIGIVNTPYQSMLTAHEQFGFLALLDMANSLARLGAMLLLALAPAHALRWYSVIFALTTLTNFVAYHWRSSRKWPEDTRLRRVGGWQRYKSVLAFNNWNMLATLSYMANTSGTDLLLNAFFGTATNGAYAISKTVRQSVMTFTGNFDNASAPQIIQAYAAHDKGRYTFLCNKIGRINLLAFELLCFPLLIELDFVLRLWLGKVPEGAYELTFVSIVQGGIAMTCGGIYNLINASGRIKWFKINVSFFFLICLPIGYVWLGMGGAPYTLLVLFTIADVMQRVVQLVLLRTLLGFPSWQYAKEAYGRPLGIAALFGAALYVRHMLPVGGATMRMASIAACAALTALLIVFVGLHGDERRKLTHAALRLVGRASNPTATP